MLETLDQVDWQKLGHAYGEASDVPNLIRALASDDGEVRKSAIYELYGNIWHQGTVYEATAYAVPFLIELLEQRSVGQKEEILLLLKHLGTGNSYLDVHGSLDWYRNERDTPEFIGQLDQELIWVNSAHDAVVAGTPTYLLLLANPDPKVRAAAANTLAICVERREEAIAGYKDCLQREQDPPVRASLLQSWNELSRRSAASWEAPLPSEQSASYASRARDAIESPLVRFTSALLWMESAGPEVSDEALGIVRETLDEASEPFEALPGVNELGAFANVAWALNGDPQQQREWLLEGVDQTKRRADALGVIEVLCRERRSHADEFAPRLVDKLAAGFRAKKELARTLTCVGEAAIAPLQNLEKSAEEPIRKLARETLDTIQNRRAQYELDHWLIFPKGWQLPAKALELLQGGETDVYNKRQAIAGLGKLGPKARLAAPRLKPYLNHGDQWLRVNAAWALWKIERDPELVLKALLEELRCRPAGFIVLDCLADMGRSASAASAKLRAMIDSDRRLVEIGATDDWAHEDDMFRAACRKTLAAIETDSGGDS